MGTGMEPAGAHTEGTAPDEGPRGQVLSGRTHRMWLPPLLLSARHTPQCQQEGLGADPPAATPPSSMLPCACGLTLTSPGPRACGGP